MKNFKKFLACTMSVATLGSLTLIPMDASATEKTTTVTNKIVTEDDLGTYVEFPYSINDTSKDYSFTSDVVIGEYDYTYYPLPDGFNIQDIINGNGVVSINGSRFVLNRCTYYGPSFENAILIIYVFKDADNNDWHYVIKPTGEVLKNVLTLDNGIVYSPSPEVHTIKYKTIGDSENKPITEITVGDSTFPRGDINLDGKVNTVDLLMLKKYLLGLMEW